MKKSLLILAVAACSCSLYAQEGSSAQEVLSFFTKYNPSVLQKAQQDESYREILEEVVYNTQLDSSLETRLEMIALVRNFDNSIKLSNATQGYEDAFLLAVTNNSATEAISQKYRQELTEAYAGIWAVSVNIQEELLSQYKHILKDISKNTDLTAQQRAEQQAVVKGKIQNTEKYLKQLKNNSGEYIASSVEAVMASSESNVYMKLAAVAEVKRQMQAASEALESANLQIKNNNKKPVAK